MLGRFVRLFLLALGTALALGCGATAPSRFYTLGTTATADGLPPTRSTVIVGPAAIPASVDRPQFVVQVASNRVEFEEFDRWAAPLGNSIASVVAADLAVLLGNPQVATGALANFNPDYRVTLNVQRFESVRAVAVTVDALWTVQKTTGGPARSGRTPAAPRHRSC